MLEQLYSMSKDGRLDKVERKVKELETIKNNLEIGGKQLDEDMINLQHKVSKREGEFDQVVKIMTPLLRSCEYFSAELEKMSSRQTQLEILTNQNQEEGASETENRLLARIRELQDGNKTFFGRHWSSLVLVLVCGGCAAALLKVPAPGPSL